MAPTYRCVVHDQHGPYVCWQGSDIAEALANAEQHVGAYMVSVERFEHAWGGYWKCILHLALDRETGATVGTYLCRPRARELGYVTEGRPNV